MELLAITFHYITKAKMSAGGYHPVLADDFSDLLEKLKKRYLFISEKDLVLAVENKKSLPPRSCLVTFDDGLKCQMEHAVPILEKKHIPAIFFVPTAHLSEHLAYMVHKVHHLLSVASGLALFSEAMRAFQRLTTQTVFWSESEMKKILNWYRYDNKETAKFKFLINHYLEPDVAEKIVSVLFNKYYQGTESNFCAQTYFSAREIKALASNEMFSIGLHTHSHLNIPRSSEKDVSADIKKNFDVLCKDFGLNNIVGISYPFGSVSLEDWENKLKRTTNAIGLKYGFTTLKGVNSDLDRPFILKRQNPNDLAELTV